MIFDKFDKTFNKRAKLRSVSSASFCAQCESMSTPKLSVSQVTKHLNGESIL